MSLFSRLIATLDRPPQHVSLSSIYSLLSILDDFKMDVSIYILCLDISILESSKIERREYFSRHARQSSCCPFPAALAFMTNAPPPAARHGCLLPPSPPLAILFCFLATCCLLSNAYEGHPSWPSIGWNLEFCAGGMSMAEGKDGNNPGLSDLAQTGHRRATSFVGEPRTTRVFGPGFPYKLGHLFYLFGRWIRPP